MKQETRSRDFSRWDLESAELQTETPDRPAAGDRLVMQLTDGTHRIVYTWTYDAAGLFAPFEVMVRHEVTAHLARLNQQTAIQTRPRGMIHYEDASLYDAVGDGQTDDTEALQRTLDAAAAGCRRAYFPAERYRVDGELLITGELVLDGAGRGAYPDYVTALLSSHDGDTIRVATDRIARQVTIRNLMIDSTLQGRTAGAGIRIERETNSHVILERVRVHNHVDGIVLVSPVTCRLSDCWAQQNLNDGFVVRGQPPGLGGTSTLLTNCMASTNGRHGYNLADVCYSTLISCASDHNAGAGYYWHKVNHALTGNTMIGCGAELNQVGIDVDGIGTLSILGGYAPGSAIAAVRLHDVAGVILEGFSGQFSQAGAGLIVLPGGATAPGAVQQRANDWTLNAVAIVDEGGLLA